MRMSFQIPNLDHILWLSILRAYALFPLLWTQWLQAHENSLGGCISAKDPSASVSKQLTKSSTVNMCSSAGGKIIMSCAGPQQSSLCFSASVKPQRKTCTPLMILVSAAGYSVYPFRGFWPFGVLLNKEGHVLIKIMSLVPMVSVANRIFLNFLCGKVSLNCDLARKSSDLKSN